MDKYLHQFILIYEQKSISKASRVSGITQPTLSENLKKLEEKYGVALFYRESRGVTPTPSGLVLYKEAKKIQSRYESVNELIAIERARITRSVRIGSGEAWWSYIVKPALFDLDKIAYHFIEGNNYTLLQKLIAGNLDFIVGHELRDIEMPADVKFVPLFNDRTAYYVSKDHVLASSPKLTEGDICIFRSQPTGYFGFNRPPNPFLNVH